MVRFGEYIYIERMVVMLTERRIEIWFEKAVDRLDKQFMSGVMCSAEYEVEYRELKNEVERLYEVLKVGA